MISCPGCHRETEAGGNFCGFCGHPLASPAPESGSDLSEQLPGDVLMRRIVPGEMQGLVNKTVVVEEGQAALLLIGGRHDRDLGPGKHSIGNVLSSTTRDASIVLFQNSDVPLTVSVPRLLSSDPLPLSLDFRLVLKIEEPMLFFRNLFGGADSYDAHHLAAAMYPVVEEGCEAFISARSIRDLGGRQETSRDLGMALSSHLQQPLDRWGLGLVLCQALSIRCEAWDEVTQTRTEYFVTASEEQADLESRKRLFDVFQESQLQTMAEETLEVIGVEKRVSLWARLRQAVLAKSQGEIQSQAELEDTVRQADKDRLLKEDEHHSLGRSLTEAQEDHEKARAFVLQRVEAEGQYELQKLDLGHRFGLSQERLALEVAAARQEMEQNSQIELSQIEFQIDRDRRRAQFEREQAAAEQDSRDQGRLGDARTAASIAEIERDQDAQDLSMLTRAYGEYRGVKREDQRGRLRIELERQEGELELRLRERESEVDNRIREGRNKHDWELERIDSLSKVGIETLIATAGAEQAEMLTQLARTRAFSGCSPQQILAMQAESSPQVADALREILTATAADGQLENYERLITEIKEGARTSQEEYQRNLTTLSEMFNKALDSVKDTAVAFSSNAPAASQRPDLRAQAAPDGTVTLLFSDIVGSTAMFERLGDIQAQEVVRDHNSIINREVEAHGGSVVKSMGDGFMLAFSSGHSAISSAVAMQRSFGAYNSEHSAEPVQVRIGLHTGDVIKEGEDFFGRNVILAARVAAQAQGGEILVSSLVKQLTESRGDIRFDEGREVELKGLDGKALIYSVQWQ